ncbi:hypothetical protein [Ekhidna sp.]|uniref:hypothetical protein n=1 Tax=Ekhidna sp. TaxID=2608089 RepID=UPI003296DD04
MKNSIPILLAIVLFVTGCQLNEKKLDLIVDSGPAILNFQSEQEADDYLNRVQNLSLQELIAFEEARGFTSLQRKADMVMDKLADTDFSTEEELESFISKNSKFIKIIEENGERRIVRAIDETSIHLLANEEGLFQIEDQRYKLFNNGIISSPISKADQLDQIISIPTSSNDEINIVFQKDNSITPNTESVDCLNINTAVDVSYNNRTTTSLYTKTEYAINPWRQTLISQSHVYSEYKVLGLVWKPVKRSLTGFFKYNVSYSIDLGPKTTVPKRSYRPVGVLDYRWINKVTLASTTQQLTFYTSNYENLWAWGDSPSTGTKYLSCNADEICTNSDCEGPSENRCAWVACPSGQYCSGGQCIPIPPDPCFGVICSGGETCIDGTCQDDPTICGVIICDGICVDGVCVSN